MQDPFEKILAAHCGPTLTGLKPANLVSCKKLDYPNLPERLFGYTKLFENQGIHFTLLSETQQRFVVFVYHKNRLYQHLFQPEVSDLLQQKGYPLDQGLQTILSVLKQKMADHEDYPHEIGLFLGYPLADVVGFMEHKGENYVLNGYWKVYANPMETQKQFEQFSACKKILCGYLAGGVSLFDLFRGVPIS